MPGRFADVPRTARGNFMAHHHGDLGIIGVSTGSGCRCKTRFFHPAKALMDRSTPDFQRCGAGAVKRRTKTHKDTDNFTRN
jgi:hypothetical protein